MLRTPNDCLCNIYCLFTITYSKFEKRNSQTQCKLSQENKDPAIRNKNKHNKQQIKYCIDIKSDQINL
jgi:uncharacterized protein YbcC (UPF0753/DUF2309 family)